jgi:competence protein ComEC
MYDPLPKKVKKASPFKGFLPFFWLAFAGVGGILLANGVNFPAWVWGMGFGLCTLLWLQTRFLPKSWVWTHRLIHWTQADRRLPGVLLAACFFLCAWRFSATQVQITPDQAAFYNDRGTVELLVRVIEAPDPRDSHINLTVEVESLALLDARNPGIKTGQIKGKVLLQVQPWQKFAYGDRLKVIGELQTPFEAADFSYRDYLARKGILSTMAYANVFFIEGERGNPIKAAIINLGDQGYTTLQRLFPSPESELLAGILLGREQGISPELQDAFRRTGTSHIIAISGFNMAILAGLFSGIFTRLFGRRWGALTAVIGISFYSILVGGSAAVVRAAIMGALGVMGGMFGRRQNGLNSLGLAGLGMMLLDPNVLWDIGFQLSIAATLGLVLYAQPLEERMVELATRRMSEEKAQKLVGPLCEFLLFSLAAQVMTIPIIAYHFDQLSWVSLLANPLVLPVQSLVMILGGLALLGGLILPGLGQIIAIIVQPFVTYTIRMVSWIASITGSSLVIPDFHFLWVFVYFALLFFFTLLPKEQRKMTIKKAISIEVALLTLFALVIFVWNRVLAHPDDLLHLALIDDQGSTLIQTPAGKAVLIGGGSSPSHLQQILGEMLPPGGHQLEAVMIGSPARDDLNGLTGGLKQGYPEMVIWAGDPDINQTSAAVYGLFYDAGVSIFPMQSGQQLDLGDEIELRVLWVGERGSILWLSWGNFSALLPIGKVDDSRLSLPEDPDVLLINEDMKIDEFPLDQIKVWSPKVILFTLEDSDLTLQGEHEIITILEDYPILNTVAYQWVQVSTDGEQLWVNGVR